MVAPLLGGPWEGSLWTGWGWRTGEAQAAGLGAAAWASLLEEEGVACPEGEGVEAWVEAVVYHHRVAGCPLVERVVGIQASTSAGLPL